ncbi:MAG TPA: M18 family aminopeptidase [Streptosporangiaceae bacterium]|nr:M18 family aminopeptidase [Streptosporangiaceae bacterium]
MSSTRDTALDLIAFIDASPSPYHAAAEALRRLRATGFTEVAPTETWPSGEGRFVTVDGGTVFAWVVPEAAPADTPFRLIGAHTDSPTLRVKPRPDTGRAGFRQIGVEVYGGPLLNSWLDRDLGLAGRVVVRAPDGPQTRLLRVHRPVTRVPQLAIHLDTEMRSGGLTLDPQQHLVPIWSLGRPQTGSFRDFLATELDVSPGDVLTHDIVTYDLTGGSLAGVGEEFVSSARLDNLGCTHASVTALAAVAGRPASQHVSAMVLFDNEEIGSVSATGARGAWLGRQLERSVLARGGGREDFLRAVAGSVHVSADMTHATHPNYQDKHEPDHQVALNGGPVVKMSANVYYATDAATHAAFLLAAEQAGVPVQYFVNKSGVRSGSTIGPYVAAGLAMPTVDVGNPALAMHSARELGGAEDPEMLIGALSAFLSPAEPFPA